MAGKLAGLVLLLVGMAASGFLMAGLLEGKLQASGLVLGAILFVLPFLAGGVYILLKSSEEEKAEQRVMREKEILTTVETRGRVKISDLCLDLHLDRSSVQALLRDLVGKGLFTGSINWQEGLLISAEAKSFPEGKCPHCGGELQIAGKGVIRCPYCGSEIYR